MSTSTHPLRLSSILLLAAALLCAARPAAAQTAYSRIVVFGDSLSDTGNSFAFVRDVSTPPDYGLSDVLVPAAPYANGGQNLTNGATWIEYIARQIGLAGSVRPAFRSSSPLAGNYSLATSRAREDGQNFNLLSKVGVFLAESGGVAPSDALYVIAIGGNDVRDALTAFPAGSDAILADALEAIEQAITLLYRAGARRFLVWNVPDIGLSPAVRIVAAQNPSVPIQFIASTLTDSFNTGLLALLAGASGMPDIEIAIFDAFNLLRAIVANPSAYASWMPSIRV